MNFKNLNESFNRMFENMLNETDDVNYPLNETREPYVIYKELGKYKGTPKSNYDAHIQNARAVMDLSSFNTPDEIIDYFIKYGFAKNPDEFEIIEESCNSSTLKEEVTVDNAFDELQNMKDIYGADAVLEELARAIGNYKLADALNYLKRVAFDEYDDVDESLLTEKNWNVTIISGSKLRNAIESEDITEIIPSLIDCYKELASKVNDVDRYAEEDIAELEFILQDYNSGEIDDEEAEDAVDYKLSGFYDLCDNVGAFVALNEKLEEARSNYGGKKGPFWYFTKHGIGPGMLPKDVDIVDIYEDDNMGTWVALDSILTTDELKQYEMKEQNPPIK